MSATNDYNANGETGNLTVKENVDTAEKTLPHSSIFPNRDKETFEEEGICSVFPKSEITDEDLSEL